MFKKFSEFPLAMGDQRELRVLLSLSMIGLFTVSAYHALTLPSLASSASAYGSAVLASFAFVWGMMIWLAYEDPVRFREIITVTIVGLFILALLELFVIMSGHASKGQAVSPIGPPAPLEDALWAEVGMLAVVAILLLYFRPKHPPIELMVKES